MFGPLLQIRLANQLRPIPTTALVDLVSAVEINGVTTTCSVDLRDRVMQLGLDAALERNGDKVREPFPCCPQRVVCSPPDRVCP